MTYPCSDAFLTEPLDAKAHIVSSDPASSYPDHSGAMTTSGDFRDDAVHPAYKRKIRLAGTSP